MKNIGKNNSGPVIEINLLLRGQVAAALLSAAIARKVPAIDLLADVIETICAENLFDAVIDT